MNKDRTPNCRATALLLLALTAPAQADLRIEALDGGVVSLAGVTHIMPQPGVTLTIEATGADSRIELPSLLHLETGSGKTLSSVTAGAGAVIQLNADHSRIGDYIELHLFAGGHVEAGTLEIAHGAHLSGNGRVDANLIAAGELSPGSPETPIGRIAVSGDYRQDPVGELHIGLAGVAADSGYDRLDVAGEAVLDGRLQVSLVDDFRPHNGSRFTILGGKPVEGRFATTTGLDYSHDAQLLIHYPGEAVELEAYGQICPDWDTDCDDMPDAWELAYFHTLDRDGSKDFDGDGISDLDEYLGGTDPTLPEGAVRLILQPGMNLVSYPFSVPPGHARCRQFLDALGGTGADALQRIDPITQSIEHCTVDGGTDFAIRAGVAYIAMMSRANRVILEGDTQCPAIELQPGINPVGPMMPDSDLGCYDWLALLQPEGVTLIQEFDPQRGSFHSCAPARAGGAGTPLGADFPIIPGVGYLLHSQTTGLLVLPECPTP
jgi:hypothetical protein